jgi:hypothetical protein
MTPDASRRIAAGLLAATGLLHLVLVPESLGEQAYVGELFILGGLSACLVAARLWTRDDTFARLAGAAVAAGMGIGFVLSRTTGLPAFHPHDWELSGLLSLVLEAAVVALAAGALGPRGLGRAQTA